MPNFSLSHKRVKVVARMRIGRLATGEKTARRGLRQRRRDPAQGLPDFAMKLGLRLTSEGAKSSRLWPCGRGLQEHRVMKLFTGSLAAGLVLLAGGAQAQVPGPYTAASDFDAPY